MNVKFFHNIAIFAILLMLSCTAYSQERSKALTRYILQDIASKYKSDQSIGYCNLVSALGAISGYAVQQGLREDLIERQNIPANRVFIEISTTSGEKFYYGDFINQFLFESKDSLNFWHVLTSEYKGDHSKLPSIEKMAELNASRIGHDNFGSHSVPKKYTPKEGVKMALQRHWPEIHKKLKSEGLHPLSWGWEITSIMRDIMNVSKVGVPEEVAIKIFMESAIAMSKYDLKL